MSSAQKIRANRTNAKSSTGPKTAEGKARAAQNAHRHGLSVPIYADPRRSDEIEALAKRIVGHRVSPKRLEIARRIAEAQIDIVRARQARLKKINEKFKDLDYGRRELILDAVKFLVPYIREHGHWYPAPVAIANQMDHKFDDPHRFVLVTSNLVDQLTMIDRYERRALSRRKFAIREFDALLREHPMA